jgi:hypothetical protein
MKELAAQALRAVVSADSLPIDRRQEPLHCSRSVGGFMTPRDTRSNPFPTVDTGRQAGRQPEVGHATSNTLRSTLRSTLCIFL